MSYIVFDLDETLGELFSTYYFVASLRPEDPPNDMSEELKEQLATAYNFFVKEVLKEEESLSEPLGVLRPGILRIFEEIQHLKTKGLIKGVAIYSNNGHLESLEFIRDLIHTHLNASDVIQECIHWGHPIRKKERGNLVGAADKTWGTLSNILKNNPIKAPDHLSPSDVYFFDDQLHPDLKNTLVKNYIQVPSYNFKASFNTLEKCYTTAINKANVNIDLFIKLISDIFGENPKTYEDVLEQFKRHTKGTSKHSVLPQEDNGIILMRNILQHISDSKSHVGGVKRKRYNYRTRKNIHHRQRRNDRHHGTRKK